MIVLDTNVISELTRKRPEPAVVEWVDSQPADALAVTSVTAGELRYGVERMPDGKRKEALREQIEAMLSLDLGQNILPFDDAAAKAYGRIAAGREAIGRPISQSDAQIAAICEATGSKLATRNVDDFASLDIPIVNPWP